MPGVRFNPYKRFKRRFEIPGELAAYDGISWPCKAVYGALLSFVGPNSLVDGVWPDQDRIGERIGMKNSSVCEHLKTLVKQGFFEVEKRAGKPHYFFLEHPVLGQSQEENPAENIEKVPDQDVPDSSESRTEEIRNSESDNSENRIGAIRKPESAIRKPESAIRNSEPSTIKEGTCSMNMNHEPSFPSKEGLNLVHGPPTDKSRVGEENNPLNLLIFLAPLAGRNWAQAKYSGWMKRYRESDILDVLKEAVQKDASETISRVDWAHDELERRFNARGGAKNVRSSSGAGSGYGK